MAGSPVRSGMTRVAKLSAFGFVIVQGVLASYYGINPVFSKASAFVSLLSVVVALSIVVWASLSIHGPLVPPRRFAFIGAVGATLRLVALPPAGLPFAWQGAGIPVAHAILAAGYVLLLVAFTGAVRDTAKRVSIWFPHMLSVGCGFAMWLLIVLAAFGPLPGVPTVLSSRDVLALWLLSADMLLTALTATVALGSLRFHDGVVSMPWLWVVYGLAVTAMGDSVQPLLKLEESAMFTGLLWGLGYLLVAVGFSMLRDSVVWNESRRSESRPLLVYERPVTEQDTGFWDRLGDHHPAEQPHASGDS